MILKPRVDNRTAPPTEIKHTAVIPTTFFKRCLKYSHNTPAFVHIPKTGGTYIAELYKDTNVGHAIFSDTYEHECKKGGLFMASQLQRDLIQTHLSFAIIRNPFDMLVSLYYYHPQRISKFNFKEFKQFILAYDDEQKRNEMLITQSKFLFSQIFDNDGKCVVDFLLRQETLDAGLYVIKRLLCEKQHIPEKHIRVSDRNRDFTKYFDVKTRKIVENLCERELKVFGYSFEGITDDHIIIDPSYINYNTKNNKLSINNNQCDYINIDFDNVADTTLIEHTNNIKNKNSLIQKNI